MAYGSYEPVSNRRPDVPRRASVHVLLPSAPTPLAALSPRQALSLQRAAGNRAASRILARWSPHPDSEKKGVFVPDVVAGELRRFNPPKNQ
jgi:hypothetical protein